jgi:RNA polymerase sigma-70 factor (ECF subfamily)
LKDKWTDADLFKHFKKGDERAFEDLYRKYFKSLSHYGFRICQDKDLIENAIQDLFIDLWRRRAFLGEVENVKFYLIKSVRNQLIRNSQKDILENSEDVNDFLDYLGSLSVEQTIIQQESDELRNNKIKDAISKLSTRQKEVIHLRYFQNLSLDEISSLIMLPKQVVKNLLSKSYAVLRIYLKSSSLILLLLFFI